MTSYRIFIFVVTVAAVLSVYLQTTDARIRRKKILVVPSIPVKSCKVNADCEHYEKCVNGRQCRHACYENLCSPPKYCTGRNHTHSCDCSHNRNENGFLVCQKYCEIDYHCDKGDKCTRGLCSPVCDNACGENAICSEGPNRTAICACPAGMTGNPQRDCRKACDSHDACNLDERCNDIHQCVRLCQEGSCGEGALCSFLNHTQKCVCFPGQSGDPNVKCEW